jgi:hypothetical protein
MTLPAEFASEFAAFPAELRQLVEEELKAGNTILAIDHGFPAAPCGASIKLAEAVSDTRRKSFGGVNFYPRNNSNYAGEFTTESRHFFVLEPPLPPEPYPDMDAIRQASDGKPEELTQFALTGVPAALPELSTDFMPKPETNPAYLPQRSLTSRETATAVTRLLHFQDRRPPHEIQFELERSLMALFTVSMVEGRLVMTTKAMIVGSPYDFEFRFEASMFLVNCYSLRVETSWANAAATNHDYCRKTAAGWFSHWTRDFTPCNPLSPDEGSSVRYEKICAASLNAEAHLDTVPVIQQTILAEMKRGMSFAMSHKEGGSSIYWRNGTFAKTDYGDYPGHRNFSSDEEFLKFLRQFYDWETSKNAYPEKVSEFAAWKLILRLLRK